LPIDPVPSAISIFAPRGIREMQSPLKDHVWPTAVRRPELRIEARGFIVVPRRTGIGANRKLVVKEMDVR